MIEFMITFLMFIIIYFHGKYRGYEMARKKTVSEILAMIITAKDAYAKGERFSKGRSKDRQNGGRVALNGIYEEIDLKMKEK